MRILDKYIFKKTFLAYLLILLSFMGLHLIIDIFSNLADFLKEKPPFLIIFKYYFYLLPLIFLRTSTFALPISILFALGELNRDNEIISIRSAGISNLRIAYPLIILAIFLSVFTMFLQEKILIWSEKKAEDIKIEYISKEYKANKEIKNLLFRTENQSFFVRRLFPQEGLLQNVVIFTETKDGFIQEKIVSPRVVYIKGTWIAKEAMRYQLDSKGRIIDSSTKPEDISLSLEDKPQTLALKKSYFYQYLPLKELKKEIKKLHTRASSSLLNNLIIDYYRKLAEPWAHFFLAICSLPFALQIRKRKATLSALGLGFILGGLYYLLFSVSIALGKAGVLLPFVSSWLASVFFATTGVVGLLLIK